MPKINILPKHLAELIAAGEVVERPASVVKELTENSIDAGATKITVEIKNGGVRYIRITDNGCGIAKEDIRAAFISHATSKISTKEDLDAIFTLGFRGEALASVAAVSHAEMLTRPMEEEIGSKYTISGGEEQELCEAGCPVGTTIIIRDLFYNTPARMKFLKKDMTEGGYVQDVVSKIALSHPEISITFIKDNKRSFFTPGDGRLTSVIAELFGKDFASSLVSAEGGNEQIKVSGYISKPVFARANRTMQHCFVNGRYVKIPVVASALDNAYKNRIMVGKYPACVLFFEVDPRLVDVNVHPAKTQIRFANEKAVYDAVYFTAVSALEKKDEITRITAVPVRDDKIFTPKTEINQVTMRPAERISLSKATESAPVEEIYKGIRPEPTVYKKPMVINEPKAPFFRYEDEDEGDVLNMRPNEKPIEPVAAEPIAPPPAPPKVVEREISLDISFEEEAEPDIRVIGEVFGTYILAQMENKLIFVDKHAAHERIIFNDLKKRERQQGSQLLLSPTRITLSQRDYTAVTDNIDIFTASGWAVEDFGDTTVIVRECPAELSDSDVSVIIEEMADKLSKGSSNPESEKLEWLYHSTACRAAIKAGDKISLYEMEDLVKRVLSDDNVRYCPHGRPVIFTMSENEIKKLFGRNG